MNTAANIDFAAYQTLKQSYLQPNINLKAITHHDLSKGNYTDTPPYKALQLTPNLRFLNLSHNNIDKFSSRNLVEGAPQLEELNLSYNNIKTLDDIVELGGLLHLKKFSFIENPITKTIIRVKLVEFLLNPSKYKPYEAVKILTATYDYVVNKTKLSKDAQEEAKTYKRMLERDLKEIGDKEFEPFQGNKYHQRGTPLKLATIECPVPRKTRFPMLKELNGQMISIQDIRQIFAIEDIAPILGSKNKEEEGETTKDLKEKNKEKKEVFYDEYEDALKGINGKIYRRYLEGYKRYRKRRLEAGYIPSTIKNVKKKKDEKYRIDDEEEEETNEEEEEHEQLKVFLEKDEQEKMKNKKSNFHFNSEEWRRPKDLDCKNAEFNIGISEYKELDRENNERKKKLALKKKIKKMEYIKKVRREAAQKKAKLSGKSVEIPIEETDPNESWHSIGSDVELKKMFNIKKKRKPKIDLDIQNNLTPVATSESSLAERESEFGDAVITNPMHKMFDFENSKISYEETEGNEENLSIIRGRSGGMRPPLTESKEWKSTMKEFKDRLENLEYTSSPGTTPQGSPVRNLEPLEKSQFEKYSHPQINHPKKQIILKKMDTIEVVGQHGSESVRKISNKFLFENEPSSGQKAKKSQGIKLEVVQSSKGGPVKSENKKEEDDFKHSKEYLIAKQRTDEAKRISMYSPFKQGNKDIEWDNIIVKNELRAIEQLSAEKRRHKKRTTTFESPPDVPLPDDDIFNFVTQKKILHPPTKPPQFQHDNVTPTNNETISLKIPIRSPNVQSPNESMDQGHGLHHHLLYGGQTPLNIHNIHHHRHFNRSGTNTSFNTEYIVALNPHHDDSSLPVTPFTGARSPKLHKFSSQHSRDGGAFDSQPEIPDQQTTPIMINEGLLLKGITPIEEIKASKGNKDNIHILTSFDQKAPGQEANVSTDRSSNDGAATGVLSDGKKVFASPHPIWSVRTSHLNLKSKLSIDIDANSKSKNTELNSTRTPNPSNFQPFSTLPSPANGTLTLKSRPSSNYKKDPQHQHTHSSRGFKKSKVPTPFQSILEFVADLEKKKKPAHKTPRERLNSSHITTTETKPHQRPGTTASKFKPLGSPSGSVAGSSGPASRPGTSGGNGMFMRHASAPQVELVSKLKTSLVIDLASPVNQPSRILPLSPTSPGGMLKVFHGPGRFDSSRLSIAVPPDSVLESARTQNSVVIDSKVMKSPQARGKVKKITTPSGGRIISKNLSLVHTETPKGGIETGKGGMQPADFLPTEKDGVTKKMRANILTGTDRTLYKKVVETMEKLEDFEKLIKESKELPGKLKLKGYEKKVELPTQNITYEQMTEYLREFKGAYSLNYNDNVQLRKLIYPVNEHYTDGELRLGRLELEDKLRELSQKTLKADGKTLVWLQEEITQLQEYLEIIQDLGLAKEVVGNPRYIETLEKDELNKAESQAVLAAHRLRLKKYYDGEALEKVFKGSIKIPEINHQQNTTESSNRGPYLSVKKPTEEEHHHHKDHKEDEKKEKIGYWDEIPKGEKGANVEKRSLMEEIREIKKIKDNAPGFPVVGSWNKKGGKEPCWKDGIERYIPEKMLTIEELMDLEKSKKYSEISKKGRRFLSDEEKMIQELEKYKGDKLKKKDLRTRVEGYLKESGRVIDEFLENEYNENEKRHDKRHMFDELMKEVYNHGLSVGKI